MSAEQDDDFNSLLLDSALRIAAEQGWLRVDIAAAARGAGLSVAEAGARFPLRISLLIYLGRKLDEMALSELPAETDSTKEAVFELLMRRFDALQNYRAGVCAIMDGLPFDLPAAVCLGAATTLSMKWIASAAGVDTSRPGGILRVKGLVAVWSYALKVWKEDDSPDMTATMAALDSALERASRWGLLKPAAALTAMEEH